MKKIRPRQDIELILGNSNSRFSGVTSTMLQVAEKQKNRTSLAALGRHFVPPDIPVVGFFELAKICKNSLPDGRQRVFHARRNNEMIQALILKRIFLAKIKIVFTSTAQRHHSQLTRWLIKQMDAVISTCNAAASYLEKPADIIVPHGVDSQRYCPAENNDSAWQELGLPGKYGIGLFGRVRPQKGLDLLIDAAIPLLKKYPDFTVVISGKVTTSHRPFFQQLMDKVAAHGLEKRIVYLGELPFEKLPTLFRAMSIVTALSRNEGFGLTVLEAMSSATAVIATTAGAWPEIIRTDIDGHIVPCDDVEALSQAMESLMSAPEKLPIMAKNTRLRIEQHYTIEREADSLLRFFASLQEKIQIQEKGL